MDFALTITSSSVEMAFHWLVLHGFQEEAVKYGWVRIVDVFETRETYCFKKAGMTLTMFKRVLKS